VTIRVIGFDQAPRVIGWAHGSDQHGEVPEYGVYGPGQYGGSDELLIADVRRFATRMIEKSQAQVVYFEQIIIRTVGFDINDTHSQFCVAAAVMCAAADAGLPCYQVLISKWRHRFLGRANAPRHNGQNKNSGRDVLKEMAQVEAARRGWLTTCHDEAEALGIWEYGLAHASKEYRDRTKADVARREFAARRLDMQK
jgi:hypothetical protein